MKITTQHHYKQDIATVFGAFGDPQAITDRLVAMGARNIKLITCEFTKQGGLNVYQEREAPAEIPHLLKKILGSWNHVVQKEQWTRRKEGIYCKIEVIITGTPVKITGILFLSSSAAGGCINKIDLDIHCSIPLLGNKLAQFISHHVLEGMQKEYEFIINRLDQIL